MLTNFCAWYKCNNMWYDVMTCKSVKRIHVSTFGGFVIMWTESPESHGSIYHCGQRFTFTPTCQTFGGIFVAFCKVADLGAPLGVMNDGLVLLVARSECFSFSSVARKSPAKDAALQRSGPLQDSSSSEVFSGALVCFSAVVCVISSDLSAWSQKSVFKKI